MLILGIDPALNNTGIAILQVKNNSLYVIHLTTIKQKTDEQISQKLLFLHQQLQLIIDLYKPNQVAIEETFVNNNPLSSLKLGQARGAIMLTIAINNLPITQYTPTHIKKTVTGNGKADKLQLQKMLNLLLPQQNFSSNDESDALAIAICHYQSMPYKNII